MGLRHISYRMGLSAVLLSLLLTMGLVIFHYGLPPAAAESYPAEGVVTEVIDGDTVVLATGRKIRYLGINAPEVRIRKGKNWIYRPQPFGKEATECNRELVQGKLVHLEYDTRKKDDYGRLLAYLREGDLLVNEELVKRGLALVDIRKPNYRYQKRMLAAQQQARSQGEKIWRALSDAPIAADEAAHHIGEFAMVHGRIASVRSSKGRLIIGFGQKERKGFSAIVYREHLKHFTFSDEGIGDTVESKRVHVYGFIRDMNGPAIVLCAPTQIDVLD